MEPLHRRSVLGAGATLATAGLFASTGASDSHGENSASVSEGDPGGWSSYRGNAGNTRYLPLEDEFPEPETVAWKYDAAGELAVVDGRVYVRTGTEVHALDADDGELLWTSDDVGADGTPAVYDDAVVVGGDRLTALDTEDGTIRWQEAFDADESVPHPTIALETVYVAVGGKLYALDVTDGSVRWTRETAPVYYDPSYDLEPDQLVGPASVSFRTEAVAVANESVFALTTPTGLAESDQTKGMAAIDATTGEPQWGVEYYRYMLPPIGATEEIVFTNEISGQGGNDRIYDPETGEFLGGTPNIAAATGSTRVHGTYDRLAVTGDHSWEKTVLYSMGTWSTPIITGNTVITGYQSHPERSPQPEYTDDAIYGFDLEDGSQKWVVEIGDKLDGRGPVDERGNGSGPYSDIAVSEDTLYIQREGGPIAALRPVRDEKPGDDEPGDDEPGDDEPGDDEPGDDEPGDDEPGDDTPGDDEPGEEEPTGDDPVDDEPRNEGPGGDDPTDDEPGTDDPADQCEDETTEEEGSGDDDGRDTSAGERKSGDGVTDQPSDNDRSNGSDDAVDDYWCY